MRPWSPALLRLKVPAQRWRRATTPCGISPFRHRLERLVAAQTRLTKPDAATHEAHPDLDRYIRAAHRPQELLSSSLPPHPPEAHLRCHLRPRLRKTAPPRPIPARSASPHREHWVG